MLICAFLFFDSLILPLQTKEARVINTTHSYYDGMNGGIRLCKLMIPGATIPVSADIYRHIKIGDTISVGQTKLSGVVQKIGYSANGVKTSSSTGFIASQGLSFLIILTAGLVALIVYQNKIPSVKRRRDAAIYLLALSSLLLFVYLIS